MPAYMVWCIRCARMCMVRSTRWCVVDQFAIRLWNNNNWNSMNLLLAHISFGWMLHDKWTVHFVCELRSVLFFVIFFFWTPTDRVALLQMICFMFVFIAFRLFIVVSEIARGKQRIAVQQNNSFCFLFFFSLVSSFGAVCRVWQSSQTQWRIANDITFKNEFVLMHFFLSSPPRPQLPLTRLFQTKRLYENSGARHSNTNFVCRFFYCNPMSHDTQPLTPSLA